MSMRRRDRARLHEVGSWWVALTVLAMALVPSVPLPELVLAVTGGLVAAIAAPTARTAEHDRYRGRTAWLRWLLPLPAAITADTFRLAAVLGRRLRGQPVTGRLRTVRLTPARPESLAVTREAVATTLLSSTPGSLVVGTDENALTLHELGGGTAMTQAVAR